MSEASGSISDLLMGWQGGRQAPGTPTHKLHSQAMLGDEAVGV